MVMEAAVLVVDDEEKRVLPERAIADGVVHLTDEDFSLVDGKVGMLAVGVEAVVNGFNEGVLRYVVVLAVVGEGSDVEELVLLAHQVTVGQKNAGLAGVDTIGGVEIDRILVDVFEDGMGRKGSLDGVLRK